MKKTLLCVALLSVVGCQAPVQTTVPDTEPLQIESSVMGMVSAAQPEAAKAGAEILAAGGNAVDAAIATGFAIAIVEPTMNSIGGRSEVLLRTAEGEYLTVNGMTEIPASYVRPEEPPANGYGVIAIPGVVAALARIHAEYGALPWEDLLSPAIRLAEEGFEILPGEAARHARGYEAIKENPGFKESFLKPNGTTYQAGELLKQPVLAKTLKVIAAEGAEAFYEGAIANKIDEDMAANGGFLTKEDLAGYEALDGRYITTNYRGFDIHSMAAPGGGGLVVKALNILENFPMSELTDVQWAAVMNQALALSVQSMAYDYSESDLRRVVSKQWAKAQSTKVTIPELADESPIEQDAVGMGQASIEMVEMVAGLHDWDGSSWGPESHHTTHFVAADCQGMTVSITQTLGPLFGSKVVTPGLGFVYASTMGTYLSSDEQQPGSRPRTTIAPTIVTKDGEVVMVLGGAGGLRILSGIVQTISRYVDQQLPLEEAVAAPRVHPVRTRNDDTGRRNTELMAFHAETTPMNGWSEEQVAAWQDAGFEVETNDRYGAFSRVHALEKTVDGWKGVADPDWEGAAVAPATSTCQQ